MVGLSLVRIIQTPYSITFISDRMGRIIFSFIRRIKGQQGELLQTGRSSAINIGLDQMNLIAVLASGNNLYLYINKHFVTNISDSTSRLGLIGVIAQITTQPK